MLNYIEFGKYEKAPMSRTSIWAKNYNLGIEDWEIKGHCEPTSNKWYTDLFVSFSVALDIYKQSSYNIYNYFHKLCEAIASSSGGIKTLIDKYINQDVKITTI